MFSRTLLVVTAALVLSLVSIFSGAFAKNESSPETLYNIQILNVQQKELTFVYPGDNPQTISAGNSMDCKKYEGQMADLTIKKVGTRFEIAKIEPPSYKKDFAFLTSGN